MRVHDRDHFHKIKYLNELPIQSVFNGIYRIANKKSGTNKNGDSNVILELHDSTGTKVGMCEQSAITWYQNNAYQTVHVEAYISRDDKDEVINIIKIEPLNVMDETGPVTRLPKALCINPIYLERLITIRENIKSPALGEFLDSVFSDDEIALAFLQVPASKSHHHNQVSGLLLHSLEVTETISIQSFRSNDERELAMVAGLFHDIGKVKTLEVSMRQTTLGKMVSHDDLTLEVCAKALSLLDKSWPDASSTLRHVWTCKSAGARYGFKQNCSIASMVRFADKLSADTFDEKIAFQSGAKTIGLAWSENKYLWRPSPEKTTKVRRRFYA